MKTKTNPVSAFQELTTTVLMVSNISRNLNKNHLNEIFGAYGQLKGVYIPKEEESKLAKNYAYLEFINKEDADKAILYMGDGQIDGLKVKVELLSVSAVSNSVNSESAKNKIIEKNDKGERNEKLDKSLVNNKKKSRSRSRRRSSSYNKSRLNYHKKRAPQYDHTIHNPQNKYYDRTRPDRSRSNKRKIKRKDSSSSSSSSESSESENSSNKSSSSS
jgi:RNA recognition motif-containing protein